MKRGGSGQVQYLWRKRHVVLNGRINKNLYSCTHKLLSLVLHKLACIPHRVCHSTSLRKFGCSEGKMSGLVFLFWFPLNSLFTQVATVACAGLEGAEELHATNVTLSKVVLLVAEIQNLSLGVWSRKAAIPNSSDQISVLLPAANRLYASIHSSVSALGRVVQLETYKQQSPLLLKGRKHRNQVAWSQIFDRTYLVSYSLPSRPDKSFCPTIAWPLYKFHSIAKGS